MPQVLRQDKIGALSHNAGAIDLGASVLTIGGQQYSVSSLSRTITDDVTLAANERYQVFAVVFGGVAALRISTNENSVGPAGFDSWKLVGSFWTDTGSAVSLVTNFNKGMPLVQVLAEKNSGAHTSTGNYQDVSWTETKDNFNCFDGTTFTAPKPMTVELETSVSFLSNLTGTRVCRILVNGSPVIYSGAFQGADSNLTGPATCKITLAKGDQVKVQAFQSSGGNLNYTTSSPAETRLSITEVPDFTISNLEDL